MCFVLKFKRRGLRKQAIEKRTCYMRLSSSKVSILRLLARHLGVIIGQWPVRLWFPRLLPWLCVRLLTSVSSVLDRIQSGAVMVVGGGNGDRVWWLVVVASCCGRGEGRSMSTLLWHLWWVFQMDFLRFGTSVTVQRCWYDCGGLT